MPDLFAGPLSHDALPSRTAGRFGPWRARADNGGGG